MEAILRSCERFGYSLATWRALSERDKHTLLAWDFRRLKARQKLSKALSDEKKLTPEVWTMLALDL
jgi:hypothetical protein